MLEESYKIDLLVMVVMVVDLHVMVVKAA